MCKKIFLIVVFGLNLVSKVSLAEETELHFIGVANPEEKGSCGIYSNAEQHELCVINSSVWKMMIAGLEKDGADSQLKCSKDPVYVEFNVDNDSYTSFRLRTVCLGWSGLAGDISLDIIAQGEFIEGAPVVFQEISIRDEY